MEREFNFFITNTTYLSLFAHISNCTIISNIIYKITNITSFKRRRKKKILTNARVNQILFMSDKMNLSLHTLPVELVYRILDNLHVLNILCSMRNVCTRINAITDSYHRYQVIFLISKSGFYREVKEFE
jgi:hypothetical protein